MLNCVPPRCGLPLCPECQAAPDNLTSAHTGECILLQGNGVKLNPKSISSAKLVLGAVSVLRLLLREGWRELEGHMDSRRNGLQWKVGEKHIVPVLGQLMDENGNILFSQV